MLDDDDDDDDDDTIEFNNEFRLTRFNNAFAPLIFFLPLPLDGVDGEGDDGTGVDPVDTRNLLLLDGDGDGDGEASVADSLTLFTFSSLGS